MLKINSVNNLRSFVSGSNEKRSNTNNQIQKYQNIPATSGVDSVSFGSKHGVVKRVFPVTREDGIHVSPSGYLRDILNAYKDAGITLSKEGSEDKVSTKNFDGSYKEIAVFDIVYLFAPKGVKFEAMCDNPKVPKAKKERILDLIEEVARNADLNQVAAKTWLKDVASPYVDGIRKSLSLF